MFSMFKSDPIKKLTKQRLAKLQEAMLAQRNGDIKGYSQLTYEAEELYKKIQELQK
ncbi:DUF6435 family protein [Thalassolituus sp.]|uniref:DUF6435 family protein n=1 Tax=Thalassolituus sp. TaxID=2030822 RepID=UPI002A7F3941|nr:DUF6435 family protein [Thalassolituus sp.]|tara:strand:- start:1211 stop:1378 length:168 start_codon:yes stop_codon:yes gene_type:complete